MKSELITTMISCVIPKKATALNSVRSFCTFHKNSINVASRTKLISSYENVALKCVKSVEEPKLNYLHTVRRSFKSSINDLWDKSKETVSASSEGNAADDILKAQLEKEQKENPQKEDLHGQSEEDRKRTIRALKFSAYSLSGMVIIGIGTGVMFMGSPVDENGNIIEDEFSELPPLKQYFARAYKGARSYNKSLQEPIREKLLPDPLEFPYMQPRMTLVMELTDVLVHPEWTYSSGWRFKKRPGVDFLLQHCAPPLFEIVILSKEQAMTAFSVVEKLDKQGAIWYKLFKESTRYENGIHFKDLHCLNRDLSKVIAVDWDIDSHTSQRNVLHLNKWDGNMDDNTLVELAIMLRTIAESEVGDVRGVLDYYKSFDDPIAAFKENQRIAAQQEEERKKIIEEQAQSRGFLSGFSRKFV